MERKIKAKCLNGCKYCINSFKKDSFYFVDCDLCKGIIMVDYSEYILDLPCWPYIQNVEEVEAVEDIKKCM